MKIVLLQNVMCNYETVVIVRGNDVPDAYLENDEHIQISGIIDVDFPMLKEVDLTAKKIGLIDKDIQKAKAGIELLEQARAELLAIPDLSNGE